MSEQTRGGVAESRKIVGVLGGMGPAATVDFLERLVRLTAVTRDQDHLRVLVDSNSSIPDRTAHLLHGARDPRPELIATALGLQRSGADFLVMPCNSAHSFADDIRAEIRIELLDWPGIVARTAASSGASRAMVLASTGTLVAGVYQRALEARGVEPVLPEGADREAVMDSIFGPKGVKVAGARSVDARSALQRGAVATQARAPADVAILACTEFSTLEGIAPLDLGLPRLDAAEIVAKHVVQQAGGTLRAEAARAVVGGSVD